jgi:hypothetical protein
MEYTTTWTPILDVSSSVRLTYLQVSLDLSHKALLPCYILPAAEWYWYALSTEPEMFDEMQVRSRLLMVECLICFNHGNWLEHYISMVICIFLMQTEFIFQYLWILETRLNALQMDYKVNLNGAKTCTVETVKHCSYERLLLLLPSIFQVNIQQM